MVFLANLTKTAGTQSEVSSIRKLIRLEFIISEGKLPSRSDDWWSTYIRRNMTSDIPNRDTSRDLWGTPILVRAVDRLPGREAPGYLVRSAGPDREHGTDDDVVAMGSEE
jgi:hypothetical protein